jgi:hypothetical protein
VVVGVVLAVEAVAQYGVEAVAQHAVEAVAQYAVVVGGHQNAVDALAFLPYFSCHKKRSSMLFTVRARANAANAASVAGVLF